MKGFPALTVIGIADALIHWQIFFVLCSAIGLTQAASNFAAFCVAAFSFYVNLLYTFDSKTWVLGYVLFIALLGGTSFGIGAIADTRDWGGLLTVTVFTALNLMLGYCFFRFVLFRGQRT
ncbi:polysaccharide synthesis protein GtrA [Pseudomonas sp. Y5-11]|jgi:putative flippase GtrA|uniref:polysaccharide synthesis protein GtrA n=1 Tax=Pseudomonas sp. Y5-11 TaxID=2749808 RepID=UPI001EFA3952|nr:polysaccharide synthesis protein GtrA [Pseudomonas sp. Y5-11]ULN85540.1 polysaccharide synthesis protein GtrA [Pseudomonas sp. Y5-11]